MTTASKRRAAQPAKRPRERLGAEARREQILEAGRALFISRPYDQVSIDDVAAEAGISKGLVFFYFGSKRELYVELIRQAADELLEATKPRDDLPPLERFRAGLEAYLDYVQANASGYVSLFKSGVGVDPEVAAIVDGARAALVERVIQGFPGKRTSTLEILARGFIGFIEAATLAWIEKGGVSRQALVEQFLTLAGTQLGAGRGA